MDLLRHANVPPALRVLQRSEDSGLPRISQITTQRHSNNNYKNQGNNALVLFAVFQRFCRSSVHPDVPQSLWLNTPLGCNSQHNKSSLLPQRARSTRKEMIPVKQVEVITVVNPDGEVSYVFEEDVGDLMVVDREIYHTT